MKLAGKISIIFISIAVILIAALYYVWSQLDTIVASAIEKYGSQVTQTRVGVSGVELELTQGMGSISGISVGNPSGFKQPNAFSLGNISTRIDVETVTASPVVINEIIIKAPEIFYEINKSGVSNFNELKKNIAAAGSGKPAADKETETGAKELTLIINKLVVEDGNITAEVAALADKTLSTKLPRIVLSDIGKKQGGATGAEVAKQLIDAIIGQTTTAVSSLGVDKYIGKAEEEIRRQLDEAGGKVEQLGEDLKKAPADKLKNLLGQ